MPPFIIRLWRALPTGTWLLRAAGLIAGIVAAGELGLALSVMGRFVSPFWPAAGLTLAVLMRWGKGFVVPLLVGAWLVNLQAGAGPRLALAIAIGSVLGPWLAAHWLRQARLQPGLAQRRDLLQLLGAGACGATLISAVNGSAWLTLSGTINVLELPRACALWWLGDALGVLVAGVPLITLQRADFVDALTVPRRARMLGVALGSVTSLLAISLLPVAERPTALGLLAVPPVLLCWLALRDGLGLASLGVALLATSLMLATACGEGPFILASGSTALAAMWCYLALASILVLLPHAQTAELARREARWRLAIEGADVGIADWHLAGGGSFLSARWRELLRDTDGMLSATLPHWLDMVHPDDRNALLDAIDHLPPGAPAHQRELRLRVGDAWQWFGLRLLIAARDHSGAPARIIASVADIGPRREAEGREQLANNVFVHLREGLVITDSEFRVLDANPSYCRISGVPLVELIGSVPAVLRPRLAATAARAALDEMPAVLASRGHWSGEVLERRRNGEPCALHVTVSTVRDADGSLRNHVLVVSDITEQRRQSELMARQAHFDELTRLPNRARLSQLMADAMGATDRDGYLLAVCYLDVDRFKAVNERLGHEAGDLLLAELANRMRSALRGRGTDWADTAARLGGDEFVLLLRATTLDEARGAVERVLRLVGLPMVLQPGDAPEIVTASVGATVYPLDASDADTLLRHADHAMYGAKQAGRNGFLFFDPEHSRRHEERVVALDRVQAALEDGELVLYYQPKVDLQRGTVLGMEALLRWNHPERGVVPPAQFLPLIEHTDLSAKVGDHVLGEALQQLERWLAQGLELTVSVNISARHLQEPNFAQRLAELLDRHPQALGTRLELEVLETAALTDIDFTSALLARCARLGVRWALDDFGTGYSTLHYLRKLPVQVLKIDRSFVHNMLVDAQDSAIVEGMISLAGTFGCVTVAEGVETAAQARALLEMGCQVGQGAGIAAPMPADAVAAWVRDWKGLFALSAAPPPASGALPAAGDGSGLR